MVRLRHMQNKQRRWEDQLRRGRLPMRTEKTGFPLFCLAIGLLEQTEVLRVTAAEYGGRKNCSNWNETL